jgi:glucose/arabinose dehydrogenase
MDSARSVAARVCAALASTACLVAPFVAPQTASAAEPAPGITVTTLTTGLTIPWDVAVLPDSSVLFTERDGATRLRRTDGSVQTVATTQTDLFVGSESGLMGVTLDPSFTSNRTYYTCQAYKGGGSTPIDIRVLRWVLAGDGTSATRSGAPVLTGIPITTGQHGGCRLRFAPDRTLHIGTGDAITGPAPQSLTSLGGKTLRVNPDGTPPTNNPFFGNGGNARFIYTYGHRNVQGLALRPGTSQMWSAEHGPDVDDEVNLLQRGGNYGWDPDGTNHSYNQSVPMTDKVKYPNAISAKWSSGNPTVATSGATFLTGDSWGRWEGALAVAELKDTGVRVLSMTPDGRVTADEQMAPLDGTIGRIRTVQSAPGGAVYLSTSNGGGTDRISRIDPVAPASPPWSPGLDVSPSGVGTVLRGSQVSAFVRGTDNRVWCTTQAAAGGGFSGFRSIPGTIASAPTAVTWGGSRIDVFAKGGNGHLLHTWSTGGAYRAWEDLGGELTSAPSAVSLGTGTIDVLARTTGDVLSRKRWNGSGWSAWTEVGGLLSAAPAASADSGAGTITVLVRGTNSLIYRTVLTATGVSEGFVNLGRRTWSGLGVAQGHQPVLTSRNGQTPVVIQGTFATAIGGRLSGAPAVTSRSSTSYVVLGRGTDGALYAYDGRAGHYTWSKVGGALN